MARAAILDDRDDGITATDALLCDFETRALDHLIAARKREYRENAINVLLEHYVSDVDDERLRRADALLSEAARLAVADMLAESAGQPDRRG